MKHRRTQRNRTSKSPADRALLPRSARSQVENNGKKKSTVPSFDRTSLPPCRRSRQLHEHFFTVSVQSVRSRAANHSPWSRSQVELNGKKKRTVSSLVMTSSTPCRRSRQLNEPFSTISLKLFRSRAVNNLPLSQSQDEPNETKKSTASSFFMTPSTPCQRSRQLIRP